MCSNCCSAARSTRGLDSPPHNSSVKDITNLPPSRPCGESKALAVPARSDAAGRGKLCASWLAQQKECYTKLQAIVLR